MDVNEIVRGVEQRRPNIPVLGATLAVLFCTALLMPGLTELLLDLSLLAVGLAVPLYALRTWGNRRMLRPVVELLRHGEAQQPPGRQQWRRGLALVDGFPFREALWSLGQWLVGIGLLLFILYLWRGATGWQVLAIAVLGLTGGVVEGLLAYHADLRALQPVRRLIEERLPANTAIPYRAGNLTPRLVFAFGVLGAMVLAVTTLVWVSNDRQAAARRILDSNRKAFEQAARRLTLAQGAGGRSAPALAKIAAEAGLTGDLLLFDGRGRVLAGDRRLDEGWLARITRADSPDWLSRRAPFLYRRQQVAPDLSLFWVADLARLDGGLQRALGLGLLAGLLMLGVGLVAAWAVSWSSLQPLRALNERVSKIAAGADDQSLAVGGSGEVAALGRSLEEFSRAVQHLLGSGRQAARAMQEHHDRLVGRLEHMRSGGDHRATIAERTATSVVEMRASIQSISEQIDSLRQAASDCSSSLFEIEQSVREVSAAAENLNGLVDDSASATTEITRSLGEVSASVDDLARRAEETDASISAMGLAIGQVEDNASETHRLTDEVSQIASHGAQSVRETIAGIEETRRVTEDAREVINRLGGQMDAVGKILTVISDVAQQTNLLALNAAIIAAAAGEHGKGFAVVADEIKDLADRTATSTKEIAALIKSVQAESRRAVDAIERGSDSVRQGVSLANKAGQALQQILGAIGEVGRMASEIHQSTRQHGDLASRISKSMGDMSSLLHEIRRAMAEQNQGGERINRISEQLREDAGFVVRSAGEQVQAVAGVSQNMERISEMIGFVAKAITEQTQGVGHVAKVAEEVRDAAMQEMAQLADVEEIADRIGRVSREMAERLTDLRPSEVQP